MEANFEESLALVRPWNQAHLLAHWQTLSLAERSELVRQICGVDFALLRAQHDAWKSRAAGVIDDRAARAISPPAIQLDNASNRFDVIAARARGEAALRAGQVGMILVAGGQGSRLGFDQPKGMFPIGPVSQRTLFQVIIDRLRATSARYGAPIPLFVMTSPATTAETDAYFQSQDDFGLERGHDLFFFEQGTLPAVDSDTGKVLLESPGQIALAPDGHGGMLAALAKVIGFERLHQLGISTLFYGQIDNPLLTVCDPEFLGFHLLAESEMTTQAVRKTDPAERVGVAAQIDGHVEIIEYSDLSPEQAARRNADGSLVFWAGNTAVHAFELSLLERAALHADSLPLHVAQKKVPYVAADGVQVFPQSNNAIKFERFIFDLLPMAKNALVVEVDRATSFAPVKNAEGEPSDTPASARAAIAALHAAWLRAAGAIVPPGVNVEIHPAWALDEAEAERRITPGLKVTTDTYFH